MADDLDFDKTFLALTGNEPFPWQREMYDRMVTGNPPKSCQIPTGLGKTSLIAIWLIALARNPNAVSRRLVYVVNRRTVVDQSTDEAEKIRRNLENLPALRDRCGPLPISTLRGQFADNREWSADPSRPAIIAGTVDMIGSRLLFSGYGIGFRLKPLHAGFLGQDVLLIHDEAHLEPSFQRLLETIVCEQKRSHDLRPMQVIGLSATARDGDSFRLTDADRAHPEVKKRIEARKTIALYPIDDEKKVPEELTRLALDHKDEGCCVLVFARTVEAVEKVAKSLRKVKPDDVETLTGTMRGKERDELVKNKKAVFKRFLPGGEQGGDTVYLVCTSAGEVGVNISADHLVCDLTTFESMAQRFGRVNRFGDRDDTRIDVVHPTEFDHEKPVEIARARTLELLKELDDGSPKALDDLGPERREPAFSPEPPWLPVSDILFDSWALTTIRGELPGRPPVEPYLHGLADWQPPETVVAWREEVGVIKTKRLREENPPEDLLSEFPLKPHELLKDRSGRVFDHIASLAKRHPDAPAWLLDAYGSVKVLTLSELADKEEKDRINGCTVLLPPEVGGLDGGIMSDKPDPVADVADLWLDGAHRRRERIWSDKSQVPTPSEADMRLIRIIDTRPDEDETAEVEDDAEGRTSGRYWFWFDRRRDADDDMSKTSSKPVAWEVHTTDVTEGARRIVERLSLPEDVKEAVIRAAEFHDLGKRRVVWQRSIGNPKPTRWLAKSGGKMKPVELNGYRHEFGSLADVHSLAEFQGLSEESKDLILHFIAVHHGFGRPHFPSDHAFDPDPKGQDVDAIAAEIPIRFARLQRKYGRWGLAYLESLLRAADYAASICPSAFLDEEELR